MGKQIRNRRQTRQARRSVALRCAVSHGTSFEKLEGRTLFSTYMVTTTADHGAGSLRQAILDANATGTGADTIAFALDASTQSSGGTWMITLASPLPALTDSVSIDATTQTGYAGTPLVELKGLNAGAFANGFDLQGPAEQVSGFVINGFGGSGVLVESTGDGAIISKNFIGTDVTGSSGIANGDGVVSFGAYTTVSGNVISGNSNGAGVRLRADFGRVQGNFIGTDVSGTMYLGNLFGVVVTAGNELIGGSPATRNVISGNIDDGIEFNAALAGGSFVQGNFIGTDYTGTHQLGNGGNGVDVESSADVQIGGALDGQGNLISANFTNGVQISDSSDVVVAGNLIGTDVTGTIASDPSAPAFISSMGNFGNGVYVSDAATRATIGWTTAGGRNVISNNAGDGVRIETIGTGVTTVEGNYIGTDISGTVAMGNLGNGVTVMTGAAVIGGSAAGSANVVSGNFGNGVELGDSSEDQSGALVQGNLIGTDYSGANAVGNLGDAVTIWGSNDVITGNVLAYSGANGVGVYTNEFSATTGTGNSIRGNAIFANGFLGIDLGGDGATPNDSLGHVGPNNYQNFPLFTTVKNIAGNVTVKGTLGAAANTTFLIDLYGNGIVDDQAKVYLGTMTVTTDSTGLASFSMPLGVLPDGVQYVVATATDTDGNTSELSASAAVPAPVFPVATTTMLSSSANPSIIGRNVTLTANVTAADASMVVGMVTFKDGNTVLGTAMVDGTGKATLTLSSLALGSHNIVAVFAAADHETELDSTSAPLSQQVSLAGTSTALSASAPSATVGSTITLRANVTSVFGSPTGTVTFMEGSTVLGTASVDATGKATLDLSTLALGSHTITAVYGGDATFDTSASSPVVVEITSVPVTMVQSNTSLSSSVNPAIVGQMFTLTANVGPIGSDVPTGTVTFMEGNTVLGSATLDGSGKAMLQLALGLGTHNITAVYGGDAKFFGSSSAPLAEQVNLAQTGIAIGSSINPATVGQSVVFTATVTSGWAGTPTSLVKFWEGSTLLGTVAIDATGKASLSISTFTVGTHNVFATYGGDGTYAGSTSATLAEQVNAAATSTTIASSANPSTLGQAITLTSMVSTTAGFVTTGTVKFMDGTTVLGSGTLDATGKATLLISSLSLGTHNITAVYGGDAKSLTSTSGPLAQLVNPVPATIGGHVYVDLAGDGLTPDDTPESGVSVQLYADSNGNGKLDSTDTLLSTQVTGANGAFNFTGLSAGKYLVNEIDPTGTVRTAPALSNYYFNVVAAGNVVGNDDFANFIKENCGANITNLKFTLTDKYGHKTVVTDLRGHTMDGETVTVSFTQTCGCADEFSLVSYTAPAAEFDPNTASQQVVYQAQTVDTHGQGTYTLTVKLPSTGHYQIDFVCGGVIYHFGPAGSNIFYTPQGRLISADNE